MRPEPDTVRQSIDSAIRTLEQIRKLAPGLLADARTFDRGLPSQSLGGNTSGGNTSSSSVEAAVTSLDLSGRIDEWLTELDETIAHITRSGTTAARLTAHGREERRNQAAICQVCGTPGITWAKGLCDDCRARWDADKAAGTAPLELATWKLGEHRRLFPDRKQPFGVDTFEDAELRSHRPRSA